MTTGLATILSSIKLDALLPTFEGEELTLEVLQDMTGDEDDFLESLQELGIDAGNAARLLAALKAPSGSTDNSATSEAAQPEAASQPATTNGLAAVLSSVGLDANLPTFEEEELTLEVLQDMTGDEDDFLASLQELGIDAGDAARLFAALKAPPGSTDNSATGADTGKAAQPKPTTALDFIPGDLPDEDVLGLVGRRVMIHGLAARPELNGQCGIVVFHDPVSNRYTVTTETAAGEEATAVTVALKVTSLDAEKAKAIPSKKKPTGPGVYVDHSAADAAARVAAEIAAKEKAEWEETQRAIAKSQKEVESQERADAYRRAAEWKKPAEPGSIEAFFKAKNRAKREDDDAKLAAWKEMNRKEAERMEAIKQRARQGPGLGYQGSGRKGSSMNAAAVAAARARREEQEAKAAEKRAREEADRARQAASEAELSKAMDALAALAGTKPSAAPKAIAAAAAAATPPAVPSFPKAPAVPVDDVLASILGGSVGSASGPLKAAAGAAPAASASPAASANDLLAAALGKAGVASAPAPAAVPHRPAPAEVGRQQRGPPAKPLPPHLAAAEARKKAELAAASGRNALDAYKKRHYTTQGGVAELSGGGMTEGTMSAHVAAARERERKAREEAEWRNKNAFVGDHYNDI